MKDQRPTIEILTEKEKIAAGSDQVIDVLVRIVPPAIDAAALKRPKLNFGIALDRSGSMDGEKMHQAREAAKYCVDELLPADTFSVVIFDDSVDTLFTNQRVDQKELLKRGIDRIEARGGTALHQGWVEAGIQVSEGLDPQAINRVLIITDWQANVGETRVDRIVENAKQLAEKGISTSTIGIGEGFNEDLLIAMAEAGQGNAWFVENANDMVRIFETELRGLIAQIGHKASLGVTASAGVKVVDILNDFETDASGRYILPNLRAGSPLDIVVRLSVSAGSAGATVADAAVFELVYTAQATQTTETVSHAFTLAYDTPAAVDALQRNADVVEAATLMMNARARKEAIEHMDRGRYAEADQTLMSLIQNAHYAYAYRPSAALSREKEDANELREMLKDRGNDMASRKRLGYEREMRRKSQ